MTWAAGISRETGLGFLADSTGGRFDFDLDPDNLDGLIAALEDLKTEPAAEGRAS